MAADEALLIDESQCGFWPPGPIFVDEHFLSKCFDGPGVGQRTVVAERRQVAFANLLEPQHRVCAEANLQDADDGPSSRCHRVEMGDDAGEVLFGVAQGQVWVVSWTSHRAVSKQRRLQARTPLG